MEQQITKFGKDGFKGVYAANDGTGGGAIAAMKGAGIDVTKIPTTGQDAELAAIQRILAGEQYMTVYKAIKQQAEASAQAAVDLANGTTPSNATSTTNNGETDVPSILLTPVAVTKENVKDTVVADGFYTAAQICTGAFAEACTAAGIQ
jgi:D-xylose transport system substrate-binding protein